MIVNNVGAGLVESNRKIDFRPTAKGAFRITSSDGQQTEGPLDTNSFREVSAPGQAPWKVEIGIDSYSLTAVADGIDSQDTVLSAFFPVSPRPPNSGSHMLVSPSQGADE